LAWTVRLTESAKKQLAKIDKTAAKRITSYLKSRVSEEPRSQGKTLKGPFKAYWRYRVGDYRIICELKDDDMVVLVIDMGHKKDIYQ